MGTTRRRADPERIITARLAGTSARYVSREPLDVDAAVAELREIAQGRGDLVAEQAGIILGTAERDARDGIWPQRALQAALILAAGADLTRLTEWIAEGERRAQRIR
jgi:hypothetical protein